MKRDRLSRARARSRGALWLAALVALGGATASAGEKTSTNGVAIDTVITLIGMDDAAGNQVLIGINTAKTGNPACSTNAKWASVLPLDTQLQRQMFVVLLQARTTYAQITLLGDGLCDISSTVETLSQVIF